MQVPMKMRKSQVLAATVAAAVLSFTAMSNAAPAVLPYNTNFTTSPDTNGDTYTPGQLEGQGHNGPTDSTSTGWVDETGEPTNVATVLSGGGVHLSAAPAGGEFSDVYNSNLADHPSAGSNGNGVALNPATYGNQVNISYGLNITQPTGGNSFTSSSGTNSFSAAGFGVEVLGSNDQVLASLFTVANPNHAGEEDVEVNESQGNQITDPTLVPPANGTNATYNIAMNFNSSTFTVFINGTKGGTYAFANANVGGIGAIAFATDNLGTDQATFSALSVVPEPASFGMVTLGGLLMLAKRRRPRIA